jgi:hypothetical protein
MATYIIFDKRSGEILHTHTEASLLGEPMPRSEEDVLALGERILADDRAPNTLGVLEIEQEVLREEVGTSRKVYVDVESRVLRTGDA